MDKYVMISLIPSMAVVVGCVAMVVVGAKLLPKLMDKDAARDGQQK